MLRPLSVLSQKITDPTFKQTGKLSICSISWRRRGADPGWCNYELLLARQRLRGPIASPNLLIQTGGGGHAASGHQRR